MNPLKPMLIYSYQPRILTPNQLIEQEEIKRKIHDEFYLNKIDNSEQIKQALLDDETTYHNLNNFQKNILRGKSHQMIIDQMKPTEPENIELSTHHNSVINDLVHEIRVDKQKIINKMIDDKTVKVKSKPKSKK
jgi:uncharacterized protein YajQ (UPF0234 family)